MKNQQLFGYVIAYDHCKCGQTKTLLWKEDTLNSAYFCQNKKCVMYFDTPTWHKEKTLINTTDEFDPFDHKGQKVVSKPQESISIRKPRRIHNSKRGN